MNTFDYPLRNDFLVFFFQDRLTSVSPRSGVDPCHHRVSLKGHILDNCEIIDQEFHSQAQCSNAFEHCKGWWSKWLDRKMGPIQPKY